MIDPLPGQIERELELQQTKEMLARLGKKVDNVDKMDKSGNIIITTTTVCAISGGDSVVSRRAPKPNSRYASCNPQGCEEDVYICTQLRLGTDTGNGGGPVDDTDPQLMSCLGDEFVEGSSMQKTGKYFDELAFLLSEPNYYIKKPTDAAVILFEQAVSDPKYIQVQLMGLAGELAGKCHHSLPLKRWDLKHPKGNTACGRLQAQIVADVDVEVGRFVLI